MVADMRRSNRDLLVIIMVPGKPVPAQRMLQKPTWGSKQRAHLERYARYRAKVAHHAGTVYSRRPYTGDVFVTITHYAPRNTRADLDNICKGLCDGLSGVVIVDDSQIRRLLSEWQPVNNRLDERVEIEVWRYQRNSHAA